MTISHDRVTRGSLQFWREALQCQTTWRDPSDRSLGEHNSGAYGCQFTERFLQALWNERMLRPDLKTTDGDEVIVLSPGTWNVAAGPDFRDAVISIAGETRRGDVEIHRSVADWRAHGHTGDPAYARVILHVVWRAGTAASDDLPPTLEMAGAVRGDLKEFNEDSVVDNYPYGRQVASGRCAARLQDMSDSRVRDVFRAGGIARLTRKAVQMLEAIAESGGGQALYMAVMRAMGYHKNTEAFQALARGVPLEQLSQAPSSMRKTALLWGASGLLPDPSSTAVHPVLAKSARRLWKEWWGLGGYPMRIDWRRDGIRPLNSPERRLAAACRWLANCDFSPERHLREICDQSSDGKDLWRRLDQSLRVTDVWEGCVTFTRTLKKPVTLLGAARRNDIIVNVFLPFIYALGLTSQRSETIRLAEEGWLSAPKLSSNRTLTEAAHRFLFPPSRAKMVLSGACEQQGAMEMYQAVCVPCGGVCADCALSSVIPSGKGGEGR
ncbi:MAG: DUF2851 family protein [Lentisphaeria bacterium]|nr:DUF2851 family protein [Lentisphaeria bacterium]